MNALRKPYFYCFFARYVIMVDTLALPSVLISNRGWCLPPAKWDWVSRTLILDR